MTLKRMHTFSQRHAGSTGRSTEFFLWENNPSEDAAFEEYIGQNFAVSDVEVDRSGSELALRWVADSSSFYMPIGAAPAYWHYQYSSEPGTTGGITRFDAWPPGYWECDQYGRPYDLNDLLADEPEEPGLPQITGLTGSVASSRALTLNWDGDSAFTHYEVHEFLSNPNATLKATLTTTQRVSSPLSANQTLQYAIRGKTADDELGPFSESVLVTITSSGGSVVPGGPVPA